VLKPRVRMGSPNGVTGKRLIVGAEERVAEIKSWFAERGYELIVHPVAQGGFFAPYIRFESRSGNAPFTWGKTALEAAEAAQEAAQVQFAVNQNFRA
jgi:hypothetical protein